MCCLRVGSSKGWKQYQTTPTKQNHGTSHGFFSNGPMNTGFYSFLWNIYSTYWSIKQIDAVPEYNILLFNLPCLILGKIKLENKLPATKNVLCDLER